jgi:hypothetical protein
MATKLLRQKTCDRCGDLIEEEERDDQAALDAEDNPPPPLLVLEATDVLEHEPIKYDDLCDKCINRVNNLVAQIALDKDPKPAEAGDDDPAEEPGDDPPGEEDPFAEETASDEAPPEDNGKKKKRKKKNKGQADASSPPMN